MSSIRDVIIKERLDERESSVEARRSGWWPSGRVTNDDSQQRHATDDRLHSSHYGREVIDYECPCGYEGPKSLDKHLFDDHDSSDFE